MKLTKQEVEAFGSTMEAMAERYCAWLTKSIKEGKGSPAWDALKSSRVEFGPGVYAPLMVFKTIDEATAYVESGEPPASANGQHAGAYIDTSSVDDFIKHTGGDFDADKLTEQVDALIKGAKHPWQQPVMVFIILSFLKQDDGAAITAGISGFVDWWDTEAETVPYPNVTKKKVRQALQHHSSPAVLLSTRNPAQAGKNMNVWLDVCFEKNLTPIIDSESPDGLKHLTEDNKAKTISIPLT